MKKMLVVLLLCFFMLSFASAWEIDNIGSYKKNTRTIKIVNSFGFGDTISEIKLITPLDYKVAAGYNKVAEFEIINNEEYSNPLKRILFYDIHSNMKRVSREFDYKVKETVQVTIQDYKQVCNNNSPEPIEGNNSLEQVCWFVKNGNHKESRLIWSDLNTNSLPKGNFTIAIFTDVKLNDKVEWIPTFFGVEIEQWAVFTQSLDVGLTSYYSFDESSGTVLPNALNGSLNGETSSMNDANWVSGLINNALLFNVSDQQVNITDNILAGITDSDLTINVWVNTTDNSTAGIAVNLGNDSFSVGSSFISISVGSTGARGQAKWSGSANETILTGGRISENEWNMITFTRTNNNWSLYVNSTIVATSLNPNGFRPLFDDGETRISGNNLGLATFNGSLDEFMFWNRSLNTTEIIQLYNNGIGLNFLLNVTEVNQTFNANTTEGNTETFEANIIVKSGLSVVLATLVYNGTNNIGTSTIQGNNTILSVSDVLIPEVDADINLTFFWAILLSDLTQVNLSTQNQTVIALDIDNCTIFANPILNFTNVDEEFQTLLPNSIMEIAVNIFSSDGTTLILNTSGTFVQNPTATCLNTPLTNDTNYLMDVIIKYTADGQAIEYFNIVDFELSLDSTAQNITLFDLNLSDSTEFQLTFTGSDFLPEESVLVFVERQFIAENVFKTVELPLTDANGQTVLHLVRNDIIYNLRFIKNGITLGVFENIIAFCEDFSIGDCRLDLSAISNVSAFEEYNEFIGISYDNPPSFDSSTNLVSFSFSSNDGTTKTVLMSVERRDIFGNQTVCTNTVVSTSGTLFCNIGFNLTETTLFTIISVDTNEVVFNTVVITDSSFGDVGYALWFILTLLLLLMASDSKNGIILVTLVSYLGALSMGWFVGGAVGVGSSGVWVLIISAAALWRINRRRN